MAVYPALLTAETAGGWGWRGEVVGSDDGGRGGVTREEANKDMTRGTDLMAVYPAWFLVTLKLLKNKSLL